MCPQATRSPSPVSISLFTFSSDSTYFVHPYVCIRRTEYYYLLTLLTGYNANPVYTPLFLHDVIVSLQRVWHDEKEQTLLSESGCVLRGH